MLLGNLLHQVFEQVRRILHCKLIDQIAHQVLTSYDGDNIITRDHMIQLIHEIVKTFPNLMSMLVCCYGNTTNFQYVLFVGMEQVCLKIT